MNALLVSDLHFTAHARDAYRWRLFEWLTQIIGERSIRRVFLLGDLTEAKDYHSARLVNRLADSLHSLDTDITVLRGNHDGLDPNLPYFYFLRHFPRIQFITTPYMNTYAGREVALLPHTPTPEKWKDVSWMPKAELVFMHATVNGAIGENGMRLDGIPASLLVQMRGARVYSGDVHVPQVIEGVEYVGAPYNVRFGDKFTPRVIVLENMRKQIDITNDWAPKRRFLVVTPRSAAHDGIEIEGIDELRAGDQVKVRVRLAPHEYIDWDRCKKAAVQACRLQQLELCGLELQRIAERAPLVKRAPGAITAPVQRVRPEDSLAAYCKQQNIGEEVARVGQALLKAAQ